MSLINRKKPIPQVKPGGNKETNETPGPEILIPFTFKELDDLMNYLINSNSGVQIFLALNNKIQEAKKTLSPNERG
jgi:hypothetical protein